MTFRISDLLIRGCLIIIGLTEVAHLAGCLLGWSFLAVTELLLAEIAVAVLVLILSGLIAHKNSIIGKQQNERKTTDFDSSTCIFHSAAGAMDPHGRTGVDGRRYDAGDRQYLPEREQHLYGGSPHGGTVYTGHVFPAEAAVPAYPVWNHQPLERYGP